MNSTLDLLDENLENDGFDYVFRFEDYELRFERLLFDDQFYIGLYKKHPIDVNDYDLMFPKIPMKIGKKRLLTLVSDVVDEESSKKYFQERFYSEPAEETKQEVNND